MVSSKVQVPPLLRQRHNAAVGAAWVWDPCFRFSKKD